MMRRGFGGWAKATVAAAAFLAGMFGAIGTGEARATTTASLQLAGCSGVVEPVSPTYASAGCESTFFSVSSPTIVHADLSAAGDYSGGLQAFACRIVGTPMYHYECALLAREYFVAGVRVPTPHDVATTTTLEAAPTGSSCESWQSGCYLLFVEPPNTFTRCVVGIDTCAVGATATEGAGHFAGSIAASS